MDILTVRYENGMYVVVEHKENKGYRKSGILCFGDPDEIRPA